MTQRLPDGLYLHLPEEAYFAQGRLGSTDMAKLFLEREGWWWSSHLNPDRIDTPTDATDFGRALHKIILEGQEAFEAAYAIAPAKADFPGLCCTVEEIRQALAEAGHETKGGLKKPDYIAHARVVMPDLPIWDAIVAEFEASLGARTGLGPADYRALNIMAEAVRNHAEIGALFRHDAGHVPLAEVSVLYTDEHGIRRRARLDEMIPTTTIDLKSLRGSIAGRPLNFAVGEQVAKHGYHVQMADHHKARHVAYRFIAEGKVHGASAAERAWLSRFPREAASWDYCWLFYQKPDAKEGRAPVVFPWWEYYGGDLHRRGLRAMSEAVQTYRRCMAEFGPERPWTRVERLHVTTEGAVDRVFVPHWIGSDEPLPDEEEQLAA